MVLVLPSCSLKKTQKFLNFNKGFLALQLVEPSFLFPSFSLNNNTRYKNKCGGDLPSSSKHTIEISRNGVAQHRLRYLTKDEVSALEQVIRTCGLAESTFVYLIPHFLQERWYVHLYLSTFGNHEFE
jgi:hypothetical protein